MGDDDTQAFYAAFFRELRDAALGPDDPRYQDAELAAKLE